MVFSETIDRQDELFSIELKSIMKKLEQEEKEHKENFKGEKLVDLLNPLIDGVYTKEMINKNDRLVKSAFNHYYD